MDSTGNNGRSNGGLPRSQGPNPYPNGKGKVHKRKRKPRVKKLRLLSVLVGLSFIALISTVFGMMMAVANDLPKLEDRNQYKAAKNSIVFDVHNHKIGVLTGASHRILVQPNEISSDMKHAIVAIEDKRFYEHNGVDLRGITRAAWQDIAQQKAAQGASTITEQFVKNALNAQDKRTVFEKLREASLAYHLERKWPKDKILDEYLNTAYFGHGAYGIESAARTYFHKSAKMLLAPEAALLAGIVASPSLYDPARSLTISKRRRDQVLKNMYQQGYLDQADYDQDVETALPDPYGFKPLAESTLAPYFMDYLKEQLVDRYGSGTAFGGGLNIKTTLDLKLQNLAEQIVQSYVGGIGPTAALVAIDNKTGGVRAMVGGESYKDQPFNLATQAQRQPGSSFKPFTLATALKQGISSGATFDSHALQIPDGHGGTYKVNNYADSYLGPISISTATTYSDNSVYVQLGSKVGPKNVARTAHDMGIETPLSTNIAMVLGGLKQGVTPFQMAHAYETFAQNGERVSGTLAGRAGGPVAVLDVKNRYGDQLDRNKTIKKQVIPSGVAQEATAILRTVVSSGTGRHAAVSGQDIAGKTGTTDDNGDAWFVGFNDHYTVAIWVGFSKGRTPMLTEANGGPVDGGTIPAAIFASFMEAATSGNSAQINQVQASHGDSGSNSTSTGSRGGTGSQRSGQSKSGGSGNGSNGGDQTTGGGNTDSPTQNNPPPAQTPPNQNTPPPTGGQTGGASTPGAQRRLNH